MCTRTVPGLSGRVRPRSWPLLGWQSPMRVKKGEVVLGLGLGVPKALGVTSAIRAASKYESTLPGLCTIQFRRISQPFSWNLRIRLNSERPSSPHLLEFGIRLNLNCVNTASVRFSASGSIQWKRRHADVQLNAGPVFRRTLGSESSQWLLWDLWLEPGARSSERMDFK